MTIVTPTQQAFKDAATTLEGGGLIAFATETVYGLGCDTFNTKAIERVYMLKGRPVNNPMIAHILETRWVERLVSEWGSQCEELANKFWPGGLTLILPRHNTVPPTACGGFNTIAVRCPSHPVARQLLTVFNGPISAPSANKSGYISPTTAAHVEEEFHGAVTVLDGGECSIGIESTVLSMVDEPTILRLGSVSVQEIRGVLRFVRCDTPLSQINAPGTSTRHYAPEIRTVLLAPEEISRVNDDHCVVIVITTTPLSAKKVLQMPKSPQEYAFKLYAVLREADSLGASKILIECPPDTPDWGAILDRLRRGANVDGTR